MVLYENINETKKTLQYMEELLQTQSRYVSYLEAINEWSKKNHKKSAQYYRSIVDNYLLLNPNQKIKPLHQIKTNIRTIMTTAKGAPQSADVSVVALNYQNIYFV